MVASGDPVLLDVAVVPLLASLPLVLIGAFLTFLGLWNGYGWAKMRSLTPTAAVDVDDGLVELEGSVAGTPGEDRYTAPYTNTRCVGYSYDAEYYHARSDSPDTWRTIDDGTELQRFYLDDGSATVLVDPASATVTLADDDYCRTPESLEEAPAGVRTVLKDGRETGAERVGPLDAPESVRDSGEQGNYLKEYRFTEARLEEGDEVYVLGPATTDPTATPAGARAVVGGENVGTNWVPFEVSDQGERGAERNRLGGAVFALVVGIALAGGGLYVTVGALGV